MSGLAPASPEATSALGANRRLIAGVAVGSGLLGLVPLPLAGDLGIDALRAVLIRSLARRHGVDLSVRATLTVIGAEQTSVPRLALATLLTFGARLLWRQLTRALLVLLRFEDMARTFLIGTFFDYYCLVHHPPGAPLDAERAQRLGRAIAVAARSAPLKVLAAIFSRVLSDLGRAGAALPRRLFDLVLSLLREDSAQAEVVVEEDLDGYFARLTRLLEQELTAAGQSSALALCRSFDDALPPPLAPTETGA